MFLQFGLTPELTNTQFAPVAALSAYYEAQNVLRPLQSVTSEAKQSDFTLENKLTQVILSILTGCEIGWIYRLFGEIAWDFQFPCEALYRRP